MPALLEQVGDVLESNIPAPWLSSLLSHGLKSDTKHSHVPESSEYRQDHGSRAGTPFGSDSSDSDCSSDSDDDTLFEVAANLPLTVLEPLFSNDVFRFDWEGIESIGESNALGLEFMFKGPVLEAQAVATSTPQAESLRAPPYHQDARSCGRPNYKHQAHQAHSAPQPDSPANETLAGGRPQDIGLQDESMKGAFQKFQACQRVDDLQHWSNARYPDQLEAEAATDGVNLYTVNAPPYDWGLLRAPRMRPIQLPGEEEEEEGGDDLLYSGPGLDGWLNGTFDGVPKTMTLSGLDLTLPVPFSTDF